MTVHAEPNTWSINKAASQETTSYVACQTMCQPAAGTHTTMENATKSAATAVRTQCIVRKTTKPPVVLSLRNQCTTVGDPYNHEYARSGTGSGGAKCKNIGQQDLWSELTLSHENRKLCCREDQPDRGWDDCQWYSQHGLFGKKWPEDSCYAGCPDGKVRVAMDSSLKSCSSGASEESDRTAWGYQNTLIDNVQTILFGTPDATQIEIWDQRIGPTYPFLKFESLKKWSSSDSTALLLGSTGLPKAVICGLAVYNSLIAGSAYKCACALETCGTADDSSVIDRRLVSEWSNETHASILQGNFLERSLVKRAPEDPRNLVVRSALTGAVVRLTISMMGYPSTGEWEDASGVFQRAIDFSTSVCTNVQMSARVLAPLARTGWDTEHPFERQTFMNMVANTIQGVLPSLRVPIGQTATVVVSAFPALDPAI
ncbi:hypothetical protein DL98DRAFT_591374 [Cadophora sp. DSE1049]|nr:hypothetical protein DL98DRAFT_591374 [Cadophora sp. DSE1049]